MEDVLYLGMGLSLFVLAALFVRGLAVHDGDAR
jgi:hypothetical protein